jgi:hypothetical protein
MDRQSAAIAHLKHHSPNMFRVIGAGQRQIRKSPARRFESCRGHCRGHSGFKQVKANFWPPPRASNAPGVPFGIRRSGVSKQGEEVPHPTPPRGHQIEQCVRN